ARHWEGAGRTQSAQGSDHPLAKWLTVDSQQSTDPTFRFLSTVDCRLSTILRRPVMTTARKVRETTLCAMMLVGSMIVLRGSARHPSELNAVDRTVLRLSSPIQGMLAGAGRWVRRGFQRYVFVVGAAKENQHLREENAKLKAELLAAQRQAGR